MRAEVWLRCENVPADAVFAGRAISVSGTLTGPQCATAATLPTTVNCVDQGYVEGKPPLARGICTEPGFWTPELPNLYRAEVVLRDGDAVVATGRRMIGLRRLGVRGRSLWLDGRRFVPRGVAPAGGPATLALLRPLAAVAVVDAADDPAGVDDMLAEADRIGVAVVIRLASALPLQAAVETIEAWSAHPSAILVILPMSWTTSDADAVITTAGRRRGTMLLGLEVDGTRPAPPPPAAIDCVVVALPPGGVPDESWQRPPDGPLLASIRFSAPPSVSEARGECDSLQARLAAWARPDSRELAWDWAGYLVT